MKRIPPETIRKVLEATDIVEVVSGHVDLKPRKAGDYRFGHCPFHTEKTPSFTVAPGKQFFHCFGCGANGDAIDFIQAMNNSTWMEAFKLIAAEAKIPLDGTGESDPHDELYYANRVIHQRYVSQLADAPEEAWDYLEKKRDIDHVAAGEIGLGYGMHDRNVFDGIAPTVLGELGLAGPGKDALAGRIIWPITDRHGRILGFAGRVLGDEKPKYRNSPDSPIYHKGSVLYGLHKARKLALKSPVVIVEGYTDADSAHRIGVAGLACCGTALTAAQFALAFTISDDLIICMDSDEAGRKACIRSLRQGLPLLAGRRQIRIASLPEDRDPDELIRESPESFMNVLDASIYASDFLLDTTGLSPEQAAAHMEDVLELIGSLPPRPFRSAMILHLRALGIQDSRLKEAVSAKAPRLRQMSIGERWLSLVISSPERALEPEYADTVLPEAWMNDFLSALRGCGSAAAALHTLEGETRELASRLCQLEPTPDPDGSMSRRLWLTMQMQTAMDLGEIRVAQDYRAKLDLLEESDLSDLGVLR